MIPPVDKDYIIALRRELHMYPELEFELPQSGVDALEIGSRVFVQFVLDNRKGF